MTGALAMDPCSQVSKAGKPLSPRRPGVIRPEEISFTPFVGFAAGAAIARLVGDAASPGPYVVRVRVDGGVRLMPHVHREDRVYTVISGVFYIGFGDRFDLDRLEAFGPGSVLVLPGGTAHFHWARSGTYVTQVSGTGPLTIDYIEPEDDPRTPGARAR